MRTSQAASSGSFSLARPWKFPAGRPDDVLCRRDPRTRVQIPVEITLRRADGSAYDVGSGVIRDLSYSGLRLGSVVLAHGRLLASCFTIDLRPSEGHAVAGRVLRVFSKGFAGFGIEFLFPGSGAEGRFRRDI